MVSLDRFIVEFDKGLRTLFAPAGTVRPLPGKQVNEAVLSEPEKRLAAGLMRVNHSGEICAQALYQGQALTARNLAAKAALEQAAQEETEHPSPWFPGFRLYRQDMRGSWEAALSQLSSDLRISRKEKLNEE